MREISCPDRSLSTEMPSRRCCSAPGLRATRREQCPARTVAPCDTGGEGLIFQSSLSSLTSILSHCPTHWEKTLGSCLKQDLGGYLKGNNQAFPSWKHYVLPQAQFPGRGEGECSSDSRVLCLFMFGSPGCRHIYARV